MTRFAGIALLFVLTTANACSSRASECKGLVGPLRSLGRKLAVAQRITGAKDAGAEHVVNALRSFGREATSTGETLRGETSSVPELGRLTSDASVAALSLGESAAKMVEIARRLKELEPARNTARIQRTLAEVAVVNIERLCASRSPECARATKLLLVRPQFPDLPVDSARAANFTKSQSKWLAELTAWQPARPELLHQRVNLERTSKAFASALATLAAEQDLSRDLAAATKAFDAQVDALKTTMTAAQSFCKG